GQHGRGTAAEPGQVVDDADATEQAGEGERATLEVPVVRAVDRGPRPGQVDHDHDLEHDGQQVHHHAPAAQVEVRAVIRRRPLPAQPRDEQRPGDAHVGDVEHDD